MSSATCFGLNMLRRVRFGRKSYITTAPKLQVVRKWYYFTGLAKYMQGIQPFVKYNSANSGKLF